METFIGYIKTPQDALIIFEACRRNKLIRVQRRLSTRERSQIRSGSIFAWDEREAGMRRWTDGRTWSPSRVLGSFLTYRELDTKRRPRKPSVNSLQQNTKASLTCSYKADGLIKQSFSICTANNHKLHLISYYTKADVLAGRLKRPLHDPFLNHIKIPRGFYPELNPLDTSGGHSAALHNLKETSMALTSSPLSDIEFPSHSPPSLSSSPRTCDDDIIMTDLLPSPHHYYVYHHPSSTTAAAATTTTTTAEYPYLPIAQDIAWEKVPSSEDQRQLKALQDFIRL
ncbi:Gti1/Pac2 family-domain-containing protein [Cokeromyces recurvatus]|uniref:Gti1/Pac2 family-domain-containing protein n=1 Tax=Cokeromyces recurvatus TaxID=90255 RepID=UPI00221F8EF1|nr:Gti1/Pac2 family-domain-containing protein [Cokeromyces recurvatus]KAI7906559.1 Gti1/Pac2 family-domain-containing protein [Cokeromyces recurvatus]